MATFLSVDEYIASFPPEIQNRLSEMRRIVFQVIPEAKERISYNMPAYDYDGILCYFAGFKNHVGFYALPTSHAVFAEELSKYKVGKGSVQFPHMEDLPIDLIRRMLWFNIEEKGKN